LTKNKEIFPPQIKINFLVIGQNYQPCHYISEKFDYAALDAVIKFIYAQPYYCSHLKNSNFSNPRLCISAEYESELSCKPTQFSNPLRNSF
jgi:hypothetical protein